jgi:hypothetical protein
MRTLSLSLTLLAATTLVACQTDTPRVDAALGKSVRSMIESQTYNPDAAAHPPTLAPEVGDGERLRNAVDANRKDVPRGSAEVSRKSDFDVGKQQ